MLLVAGLGVYFFSGWSRINCWTWEIDINSGETRYRRYWFWVVTAERIVPTWMSAILDAPDKEKGREWHPVVTLSPGACHSPHYRYHGAISHLTWAEEIFQMYEVPTQRKRRLAEAMRALWKATHSDREAGQLVLTFCEEAVADQYPKRVE